MNQKQKKPTAIPENIILRMSDKYDLGNHETSYRYAICSSPRSGSNFLCSILKASEQAGSPMEYFNPSYTNAFLKRLNKENISLSDLFKELESRRTSANGYFGNKIQFWQLMSIFKRDIKTAVAYLRHQNHLIYLYRKDKVEQAVSLYIAQQTGAYQSNDPANTKEIKYSPTLISKCLHVNIKDDFSWQTFLKNMKVEFTTICYEDLVKNRDKQMSSLWKSMGLEKPKKMDESLLTEKQTHPQYDEFVKRFKQDLGI